jgi:hypothetical protein
MGTYLETAGYHVEAEYISLLQHPIEYSESKFPNIEIVEDSFESIVQNTELMQKIKILMGQEFTSFLPDMSTGDELNTIIDILLEVGHGEDFVTIALDATTKEIAGMVVTIPNIFEYWAKQPLTTTNFDTVITAKQYRGLFPYIYSISNQRAYARGIKNFVGTGIWTENTAAMKAFGKCGNICQRYQVYTKTLD